MPDWQFSCLCRRQRIWTRRKSSLYLPKEWYSDDFLHCVKLAISLGSWPSPQKTRLLWSCSTAHWGAACFMHSGLAVMRHMGMTMTFMDSLKLPEGVWYFAATNAKEQLFIRCYSCRKDGNRSYVKPGYAIWLYLRRYADGEVKYFVSNAPESLPPEELDRAATLRWPIEQCFEECKSNLGMSHYECHSYHGNRHMLFVMIAHLFTTRIRGIFKKSNFINTGDSSKTNAWDYESCSYQ